MPYDVEHRLRVKSGEYKWFRIKGQAIWDEQGKPLRMAGSLSDISQRKAMEEDLRIAAAKSESMAAELAAANEEAQIARMKADEATRLKSEFLANMSHEIRTPMNGVVGMANLLLECDLGPIERNYAQTVVNSSEALLQILNDVLDFSKIEAGKIDLESIPFDLQMLCEEVSEMMGYKAHEKGLELLLRYPHGTPRFYIGDSGRVRQILVNLLNNAIKFTDNGHVIISLQSEALGDGKVKLHVEIDDTGIGIPANKVELIFNKFSQADQSTARKFGGTGLGLSICRELAHMMKGDIGVCSTYGVGSTFWFDIVLIEDKTEADSFILPKNDILRGLRILIVDDNTTALTTLRDQLAPFGVEVTEASSGKEAWEILENNPNFDIAVLDFIMPEMNGEELGQRIKENSAFSNIALLMVTSSPNRGDKQRMENIGFAGYLTKPLDPRLLRSALAVIAEARNTCTTVPMITQYNLREVKSFKKAIAYKNLSFSNVHILLAEDNPVNLVLATILLKKYGIQVTSAVDGDEAIKQFKSGRFDLVFMDCQMPVLDGYEATSIIRQLEIRQKSPCTPIIAFTANAMKGDDDKCFVAGMDDYITKPIRKSDLERVLIRWLPEAKRSDGGPQASADIHWAS